MNAQAKFRITAHFLKDKATGSYTAIVDQIPSAIAQGKDFDTAKENILTSIYASLIYQSKVNGQSIITDDNGDFITETLELA